MNTEYDNKHKKQFMADMELVLEETELILSQAHYLRKENRKQAGITSYSKKCVLCTIYPNGVCPKTCRLGQKKSCLKMYWHPPVDGTATKKDFQNALEYLQGTIKTLKSLPAFVFTPEYAESLREVLKIADTFFKRDKKNQGLKETPEKKKYRALSDGLVHY